MTALIDTSVIVARELWPEAVDLPHDWAVATITLGELHAGVIVAADDLTRARRLRTLAALESDVEKIPFDASAARVFGALAGNARIAGRKARPNDVIIAATAIAHGMTLYTMDRDFRAFPGLDLVLVESP